MRYNGEDEWIIKDNYSTAKQMEDSIKFLLVAACLTKQIRYTLREKKARFSCQIIRFVAPNLMNSSAVVRFNKWQVTVAVRDAEVLVKKEEC